MTDPAGPPAPDGPAAPGGAADRTAGGSPSAPAGDNDVQVTDDAATIDALRARVAELEDLWRRAAADLDNVRKRATRDVATQRADERGRVTAALLPIIDNLDLALEHADADPETIVEGVRAVRNQATEVLVALGYPRRDETGDPFDPVRHEAVAVVDDPSAAPGTVVRVVRPGYGDGDHQLRPASVVVASGADNGR